LLELAHACKDSSGSGSSSRVLVFVSTYGHTACATMVTLAINDGHRAKRRSHRAKSLSDGHTGHTRRSHCHTVNDGPAAHTQRGNSWPRPVRVDLPRHGGGQARMRACQQQRGRQCWKRVQLWENSSGARLHRDASASTLSSLRAAARLGAAGLQDASAATRASAPGRRAAHRRTCAQTPCIQTNT